MAFHCTAQKGCNADELLVRRKNDVEQLQYMRAEKMEGEEVLNRFEYIVEAIDGDYAHLRRVDAAASVSDDGRELKLVARALLPPEVTEGTKLLYEWMQYSIMDR